MSRRKSKKKSPVSFRLPEQMEEDWQECLNAGAKQSEIIEEALRRELPTLREEFRKRRLALMGVGPKTALEVLGTGAGAQTLLKPQPAPVKSPRNNG